jgi:hypothetical protein
MVTLMFPSIKIYSNSIAALKRAAMELQNKSKMFKTILFLNNIPIARIHRFNSTFFN